LKRDTRAGWFPVEIWKYIEAEPLIKKPAEEGFDEVERMQEESGE